MCFQEIIDGEPKDRPYSDDDLIKILGKQGITVARRTVTKYRKAMDIPSSRQRRDWKLVRNAKPEDVSADQTPASDTLGNGTMADDTMAETRDAESE
jgi:hypothetical protein